MAILIGTIDEFHFFVGPRIRNAINGKTRKARLAKKGVCEFCKKIKELQSAHVHGRDRRKIIADVLIKYKNDAGLIECSLKDVEKEIMLAHEPIEDTFKFICRSCHNEYDALDNKDYDALDKKKEEAK